MPEGWTYEEGHGQNGTESQCPELERGASATLLTLSNGYLGARGAREEDPPGAPSLPGTFVAGVFDALPGQVPELVPFPAWGSVQVRLGGHPATLRGDRRWLDLRRGTLNRRAVWGVAGAVAAPAGVKGEPAGAAEQTVSVQYERLVSMDAPHLAAQRITLTLGGGQEAELAAGPDEPGFLVMGAQGPAQHPVLMRSQPMQAQLVWGWPQAADGAAAAQGAGSLEAAWPGCSGESGHLELLRSGVMQLDGPHPIAATADAGASEEPPWALYALWRTRQSGILVAWAAALVAQGSPAVVRRDAGALEVSFSFRLVPGSPAGAEQILAVYTSLDATDPLAAALSAVRQAVRGARPEGGLNPGLPDRATGYAALRWAHVQAWERLWRSCDVQIQGDPAAQLAMRFALFHLLQAAPRHSQQVSIGARALTGTGYKGHVFWDTEIFALPFFIWTDPPTARRMLLYRHHTLPQAQAKAWAHGYEGALFAWESTDTGEETTPPWSDPDPRTGRRTRIWCGETEQHIAADVAYACWQYWQITHDEEFLQRYGAEIIKQTARFWASRVSPVAPNGRPLPRQAGSGAPDSAEPSSAPSDSTLPGPGLQEAYGIAQVIGPDEFHINVDQNFYTNALARWNLAAAAHLDPVYRQRFLCIAERLFLGRRGAAVPGVPPRVWEQFLGFFDLPELAPGDRADGPALEKRLGPDGVARYRAVKQPDVLMALYLLPELSDPATLEQNWDYYEPITAHGSSLGPAIHGLLAARLGKTEKALGYFRQAAAIDLQNSMNNEALGIHVATLGGMWQCVVRGFLGLDPLPGPESVSPCHSLRLTPHLPPGWTSCQVTLQWRGKPITLRATAEGQIAARPGPAELDPPGAESGSWIFIQPGQEFRPPW